MTILQILDKIRNYKKFVRNSEIQKAKMGDALKCFYIFLLNKFTAKLASALVTLKSVVSVEVHV